MAIPVSSNGCSLRHLYAVGKVLLFCLFFAVFHDSASDCTTVTLETKIYAINGTFDHIHIVASIPPKIAVSTFIGQVKGFSSGQINKRYPHIIPFAWQEDYGVFSFDRKRLEPILEYVRGQKDHHRLGRLITLLELCEDERFRIAEEPAIYSTSTSEPDSEDHLDELPW